MAAVLRTGYGERGRKARLSEVVQEQLREALRVGRFKRTKELQARLSKERGVNLNIERTYYWLGKVGEVLKVQRKTHIRKDPEAAEAFKKELTERHQGLDIPQKAKVRIWVFDEHRYDLISVLRKIWTLRGHKPKTPYQSKYQWRHLYAALEVAGENACEFFLSPSVNLEISEFFLGPVRSIVFEV